MKAAIAILALLTVLLQIKLWFGDGSVMEMWRLEKAIAVQTDENAKLRERNQALSAEVLDLKQGTEAVEERARSELGMIKQGEIFYQIVQ
jgi:cell division protein FtsB